ncbi:hypothetical protein, partial [Terrilactibacillus laevilacticus]|uniref:hypothetical protein n=1 Tax=Terrilactibacillus laevilacticus TaxID=1380157 RepID=UPI001C67466D
GGKSRAGTRSGLLRRAKIIVTVFTQKNGLDWKFKKSGKNNCRISASARLSVPHVLKPYVPVLKASLP